MADGLVAFLRARLNEDEQEAQDPEDWRERIGHWNPYRVSAEVDAKRRILKVHTSRRDYFGDWAQWPDACHGCGWLGFDPEDTSDRPDQARPEVQDHEQCPILRLLAMPYANHPDYRPEWRPEPREDVAPPTYP